MAVGDHTIERARGAWMPHAGRLAQAAMQVWHRGRPVLLSFLLVAATTLVLLGIDRVFGIAHVSIAYVLPVLIAATMLGLVPALVAAVAAVAVSAFFFYPPIYDFRVASPQQLIDLTMFVIVAVTTGQLAAAARANAVRAKEREAEIRALYNFSRRLAVATEPAEISAAVQDHLSAMTGRRVVYFAADQPASPSDRRQSGPSIPNAIRDAVDRLASARTADGLTVADAETGTRWLVRSVSPRNPEYGLLAIDMGDAGDGEPSAMHARIDALLADATASFERLGVAHAISEARLRAEAETLREALMGSVTHGLRTPLSSIIGSASILVETPAVAADERSANLVGIVRDEAERLDHDIQRLVDATRISSAGVRPHLAWADPADIVNAALARQRRGLAGHTVELRLSEDMPLVHVDPVLIEQALGADPRQCRQVLAARLRSSASTAPAAPSRPPSPSRDEGAGLTAEEAARMFERFYRGPRSSMTTTGSGLGLWIAHAFVSACAGRLEAASPGPDRGTTVTMLLPAPSIAKLSASGETYE